MTGITLSFASADTSVATVTSGGLVRGGRSVGRTTIRVSGGGATNDVPVRVVPIPSEIRVSPGDTIMGTTTIAQYRAAVIDEIGDTIPGIAFTWHSSDTTVAAINPSGLATSTAVNGFTVITAHFGALVGEARLHVATHGLATSIVLAPADTLLYLGDSAQLRATARDAYGDLLPGSSIGWFDDAGPVLAVSQTGFVRSTQGVTGRVLIRAFTGTLEARAFVSVVDTIVLGETQLAGEPRSVAVSATNVAYVSMPGMGRIVRADLPGQTFTQSVMMSNAPTEIAFNSTGARAFVTSQSGFTVNVIDVATNTQVDSIPVGSSPSDVIVEPGDSILWVGKPDSVYAIRLATKSIIARLYHAGTANGSVIAGDTLLYVSMGHEVVELDLRTRSLERAFAVGGSPGELAVSSDGTELYITNTIGYVQFWDLTTGLQIGSNLGLAQTAQGMACRPGTNRLYVTTYQLGVLSQGRVQIIDPVSQTIVYTAVVNGFPQRVVFTQDGSIGVVPNERGWVDFIK